MKNDELISDLLALDSLAEAEKIAGKSYKEDDDTSYLGLVHQIMKSRKLDKLLDENDDTKFSEITGEYIRKVKDFGFIPVYHVPFTGDDGQQECMYVMWHDELSILLVFDTYHGKRNSGNYYYNIEFNSLKSTVGCTHSGSYVSHGEHVTYSCLFDKHTGEPVNIPQELRDMEPKYIDIEWEVYHKLSDEWKLNVESWLSTQDTVIYHYGDNDAREAIKHNITKVADNGGKFLKNWKKCPYLWLFHHGDKDHDDSTRLQRIMMLPEDIRTKINFI